MKDVRMRIGFRTGSWLFPNKFIFVVRVDGDTYEQLVKWTEQGRALLKQAGLKAGADALVCEVL